MIIINIKSNVLKMFVVFVLLCDSFCAFDFCKPFCHWALKLKPVFFVCNIFSLNITSNYINENTVVC